jgi:hypothetical protein
MEERCSSDRREREHPKRDREEIWLVGCLTDTLDMGHLDIPTFDILEGKLLKTSNFGMSNVPCPMYLSNSLDHENPIHRPPQATPNHKASETNAVSFALDVTSSSSIIVTRRLIVNVKTRTRNRHTIFTQKAKL